jgi:hypothetical protein
MDIKKVSMFIMLVNLIAIVPNYSFTESMCGGYAGNGEPRPFFYGDLVLSKTHTDHGVHFVTEVKKAAGPKGKKYWRVSTVYGGEGQPIAKYTAPASDFVLYVDLR